MKEPILSNCLSDLYINYSWKNVIMYKPVDFWLAFAVLLLSILGAILCLI
jgi:hypothetical protein